jgi:hypothetical protein
MGIAREKGDFPYSKGAKALSGQGVPGGGERGQSNRGAVGIHALVKTAYRHVYSLWPPRILILCCGKFVIKYFIGLLRGRAMTRTAQELERGGESRATGVM